MKPQARVIKAVKFEDGTYTISSAQAGFVPVDLVTGQAPVHGDGLSAAHAAELSAASLAAQQEAQALLAQAQQEADFVLNLARSEAEAIKQRAQQEAELLRAQAAQTAQQSGFEQGVAAGQTAGFQAVVDEYAHVLGNLMAGTESAVAERQAWFANHEKDLVKMAVLIAQKILLTELSISRQSVLSLASAALKRINDKTQVRLRVHPDDEALVLKAKGPLMLGVDNLTSLEVVADPGVGVGGCIVETRTGIVDARVATQLAEVAGTLLELPVGDELDPVVQQAIKALGMPGAEPAGATGSSPSRWHDEDDFMPAPRQAPMPSFQAAPIAPSLPVAPAPVVPPMPVQEAVVPAAAMPEAPVQNWDEPLQTQASATVAAPAFPAFDAAPAPVAEPAPEPVQEALSQTIARMTDEEVEALHQALAELAPPIEPQIDPDAVPSAPSATMRARRPIDPSKRAADALALRLGKLKKGRAVANMQEEYDMSLLDGALGDEALEAIVRGVMHRAAGETEIAIDKPLVHNPHDDQAAADALAERLGLKKKPKRNWYEGVEPLSKDGPSDRELEELNRALDDSVIDQIMGNVVPHVAAPGSVPVEEKAPDLHQATDNLAKLLGKKKGKGNRPWYDGLD